MPPAKLDGWQADIRSARRPTSPAVTPPGQPPIGVVTMRRRLVAPASGKSASAASNIAGSSESMAGE